MPRVPELESAPKLRGRSAQQRQASAASLAERTIPPLARWTVNGGKAGDADEIIPTSRVGKVTLQSPPFRLPREAINFVILSLTTAAPLHVSGSLWSRFGSVAERTVTGGGRICLALRAPQGQGPYRLVLTLSGTRVLPLVAARNLQLSLRSIVSPATARPIKSTELPHWTFWQRLVHRLCRRSGFWNAVVGVAEMRLGREEVLSLPQYMALCPTGQCNASCGFCSVTINRTGIIKKQLPYEELDRFLAPVENTIRLFGLEGNGEPSLYDQFDDLLVRLTRKGAPLYLITNGERLTAEQVALLLACRTDSVNFSLNAATAATHRRVMRLKSFEAVTTNIRRLVTWRTDATHPLISVSFVVTRDNVHEVQEFLRFAEWDLKVDRILVRPLSEIANDLGTVEDLRDLVPYESDIEDMLDGVEAYVRTVPRRAEIVLDPDSFRAVRDDPVGDVVRPLGYEDILLAPRPKDWHPSHTEAQATWVLNGLTLSAPACDEGVPVYESAPIPVGRADTLRFRCAAVAKAGTMTLKAIAADGRILADVLLSGNDERTLDWRLALEGTSHVQLVFFGGHEPTEITVDFGRLCTLPDASGDVKLPHPKRWQVDSGSAEVTWRGARVSVGWSGAAGPYLLRSYRVGCLPHQRLAFPIEVSVELGMLGIGILTEDGQSWAHQFLFRPGQHVTELAFDTGDNQRFQVVFYSAEPGVLQASVDWSDQLDPLPQFVARRIEVDRLLLPPLNQWRADAVGVETEIHGASIDVRWSGARGIYLVRSEKFPCVRVWNFNQRVPARVTVRKGKLGIGFLGESSQFFVEVFRFDEGEHQVELRLGTYSESELRIVLFAEQSGGLDAEVDWGDGFVPGAAWNGERTLATSVPSDTQTTDHADPVKRLQPYRKIIEIHTAGAAIDLAERKKEQVLSIPENRNLFDNQGISHSLLRRLADIHARFGLPGVALKIGHRLLRYPIGVAAKLSGRKLLGSAVRHALRARFGEPKIYCQKPWTDLNNFSVDGRMDVCCIATGPSQERYALGNVFENDFQQVWNGERMREFRRTVNGAAKLPPCERCPMANNYVDPF